jgi:hypothetical protein
MAIPRVVGMDRETGHIAPKAWDQHTFIYRHNVQAALVVLDNQREQCAETSQSFLPTPQPTSLQELYVLVDIMLI